MLYNPEDLLKSKQGQALNSIYGKQENLDILGNSFEKSLVQKHVQIHGKNGKVYDAIRWINPDTGQSPLIQHPKYTHEGSISGETDVDKIHGVINNPNMKPTDKQRHLISLGIYDKHHLDELSEAPYKESQTLLKNEAGIQNWKDYAAKNHNTDLPKTPNTNPATDLSKPGVQMQAISEIQAKFGQKEATKAQKAISLEIAKKYGLTVDDKWDGYENDCNMLLDGELGLRAVMAYGTGGVGKTFVLESKILPARKYIEYDAELDMQKGGDEYDYVKIGGKIGSKETQRLMYEHRNKLLIFDDCDSMWNDEGLINVLKNTLDTSGQGKCQWAQRLPETSKGAGDEVPTVFKFNGRMIFITNLSKDELAARGASPIAESRAASSNLTMNMEQTIERLQKIAPYITLKDENREEMKDIQLEDKMAGLEALKEVAHLAKIEQLNTRVLTGIIANARRMRKTTGSYDHIGLIKVALKQFDI